MQANVQAMTTTTNQSRRAFLLSTTAVVVTACSPPSKIQNIYRGPKATGIIVRKSERKMQMLLGNQLITEYPIDLGFAPVGHKQQEGDGRTPEGQYWINRRNYNSAFFLSLGISYPNARDVARAKAAGVSPGGDIFIHGGPRLTTDIGRADWTAGCISVTDAEMEIIYQMVPDGIPIWILA